MNFVGQYTVVCLHGDLAWARVNVPICIRREYVSMCLYDNLTHAGVQVFIEMFHFPSEQFICCNKEMS